MRTWFLLVAVLLGFAMIPSCREKSQINNRVVGRSDFDFRENGTVFLSDAGRRTFLQRWQERKRETITHPYLREKLSWGLVPYIQALLFARTLRGDLDGYPPFLWK